MGPAIMRDEAVARLATRKSPLALKQAEEVAALLQAATPGIEIELVAVDTQGDIRTDLPLSALGGQGVFAKEVQVALLQGRADFAVHSAKDLPAVTPERTCIAAVPLRADPRDALVGSRLEDLPPGGLVATGSVRRRAQLAWLRPDLCFADLRGSIGTRLAKAAHFDAVVIAFAALVRLGLENCADEVLAPSMMLPQVGQGALAIECRSDDAAARVLAGGIDHMPSRVSVEAERAFLREIGGTCDLPVAGNATMDIANESGNPAGSKDGRSGMSLALEGLVASPDGRIMLRKAAAAEQPISASVDAWVLLARTLGEELARSLIDENGGNALLGTADAG
ncbi:MAG: hydroxymethylbilane synthase [Acidimicrobiales bacterium]